MVHFVLYLYYIRLGKWERVFLGGFRYCTDIYLCAVGRSGIGLCAIVGF